MAEAVSEISHLASSWESLINRRHLGFLFVFRKVLKVFRKVYDLDYRELITAAMSELRFSYAPYSGFHVAAALLTADGRIFTGVNIENAAYTPTICAERTAFFKAVSEGVRDFAAIAIVAGTDDYLSARDFQPDKLEIYSPPCGVCRQVMREFCDPESFEVVLALSPEEYRVFRLRELLPESFGPENLL